EDERVVEYVDQGYQRVSGTGEYYRYYMQGDSEYTYGEFPEGDYYVYISPNVPELYIKALLDKGVIDLSSISDLSFRSSYEELATFRGSGRLFPNWYSDLAPYMTNGGRSQR